MKQVHQFQEYKVMVGSNDSSTLSIQQAANLLNVSRPYFIGLLNNGEIAFRTVVTDFSVLAKDVVAYKEREKQERLKVLEELAEQA